MRRLKSVPLFAIAAIFAVLLAAFAPVAVQMTGPMEQGHHMAAQATAMDCGTCPKSDMALARCAQMTCQIFTMAEEVVHSVATERVRYPIITATTPREWLTVPPVSPG
jgi:hypothetical protein